MCHWHCFASAAALAEGDLVEGFQLISLGGRLPKPEMQDEQTFNEHKNASWCQYTNLAVFVGVMMLTLTRSKQSMA